MLKDRRIHPIVEVNGAKQAGDFDYLKGLIDKNPGGTEGILNGKFLPFPKKYKNRKFKVILGTGQIAEAVIKNSPSGFKWFSGKENVTAKVFAWRELGN